MRRMRVLTILLLLLASSVVDASAQAIHIVAFGTSFTNGKGVSRKDAWPAKLEANLNAQGLSVQVSNLGINGNTTRDLMRRLATEIPEGTPIVIFEYALGNDHRAGISNEETFKNVGEVVSQLVARKILVLLVNRGQDSAQLERRTEHVKEIVSNFGIKSIDIEQPDSSLLSDHQHPTPEAHTQIAASMVNPVKALISKLK